MKRAIRYSPAQFFFTRLPSCIVIFRLPFNSIQISNRVPFTIYAVRIRAPVCAALMSKRSFELAAVTGKSSFHSSVCATVYTRFTILPYHRYSRIPIPIFLLRSYPWQRNVECILRSIYSGLAYNFGEHCLLSHFNGVLCSVLSIFHR